MTDTLRPASPVPLPAERFDGALGYVRDWIEYRAWAAETPGVQYAVGVRGEILLSGAWGTADLDTGAPLTTKHLFRIASHSKTFTATATMILAARGMLRLDDRAGASVPELEGTPAADFTIGDLLAHATGVIRDGFDADYWQLHAPFPDEADLIGILRDRADILPAATKLKYSNIGYSLLGLILARTTGTTYAEVVADEIMTPLGLTDTTAEYVAERAADYAAGHGSLHLGRTRLRVPRHVDTRAMASATGFTSTAEDLVRYAAAHVMGDDRLLSDDAKRRMQHPAWVEDPDTDTGTSYGLGLVITKIEDRTVVGHSGGYPGHITQTLWDPQTGLTVSVLTNAMGGPAGEISRGALALLLRAGGPEALTAEAEPELDRFTGRFANAWGLNDVVRLGGELLVLHPQAPSPLESASDLETSLRITNGSGFGAVGESLVFERDAEDRVTAVQGGGGMSLRPVRAVLGQLENDPEALFSPTPLPAPLA